MDHILQQRVNLKRIQYLPFETFETKHVRQVRRDQARDFVLISSFSTGLYTVSALSLEIRHI